MKTCPECGELLGDSVEVCFGCHYNFQLKRKMTKDEREEQRQKQIEIERQKAEEERRKGEEKRQKAEEERQKAEEERLKVDERRVQISNQISKNPFYEYQVIVVDNLKNGEIDKNKIQRELNEWSTKGWKLHSVFNNELGKTLTAVHVGFLGASVNATIDETILIFERCIKPAEN